MNLTETAVLLTYLARVDHRTLGEDDVRAFADLLDDIPFTDAMEAAKQHLRNETTWITPALLRTRVASMHSGRADDKPVDFALTLPAADPDDVAAYQEAMRQGRVRPPDLDARRRPVAELLAATFSPASDADDHPGKTRANHLFAGYRSAAAEVRALVLSYPDLRLALTRAPIGYPQPEQWTGFMPPARDDLGRLKEDKRRTALADLVTEAQRRVARQPQHARSN